MSTPTVTVPTPTLPGEQYAALLAEVFKLGDAIFTTLNSPAMLAARKGQDVQAALAAMDADLAEAQKTGDISQVDKDSSG